MVFLREYPCNTLPSPSLSDKIRWYDFAFYNANVETVTALLLFHLFGNGFIVSQKVIILIIILIPHFIVE